MPESPPGPAIDPATFAALKDRAGADAADERVGAFVGEAPRSIAELRAALATGDADRFGRAAHALKTGSITIGALTLGSMAKVVELAGIDDSTVAALDVLGDECARVAAALAAMPPG